MFFLDIGIPMIIEMLAESNEVTNDMEQTIHSVVELFDRGESLAMISTTLHVTPEVVSYTLAQYLPGREQRNTQLLRMLRAHLQAHECPSPEIAECLQVLSILELTQSPSYEDSKQVPAKPQSQPSEESKRLQVNSASPDVAGVKEHAVETRRPQITRVFGYKRNTSELHWTSLEDGSESRTILRPYKFMNYCSLCEVPDNAIIITGGETTGHSRSATDEVVQVNLTSFEMTLKPPMFTRRYGHNSIYIEGYVYVVGGLNTHKLKKCERFDIASNRWESIPETPSPVSDVGLVVLDTLNCLYVLGNKKGSLGYNENDMDKIHELNLKTLRWQTLGVRLPYNKEQNIACFKLSDDATQLYFVQYTSLFLLDPKRQTIHWVSDVERGIESCFGTSHVARGRLYCPSEEGGRVGSVRVSLV
jgi:hypothetical protein